jgi:hypothetical protein
MMNVMPADVSEFFSISHGTVNYSVYISEKYKYIYIETPKVCCSTIKRTLVSYEISPRVINDGESVHTAATKELGSIKNYETLGELLRSDEYFKFCFIRNPYSRLLSCYLNKFTSENSHFDDWAKSIELDSNLPISFEDFVTALTKGSNLQVNGHWAPQTELLGFDVNGFKFDFIGRMDDFTADFELVKNKIFNLKRNTSFEKDNRSSVTSAGKKIEKYLNDESRQIIQKLYKDDFDNLLYSSDPFFVKS